MSSSDGWFAELNSEIAREPRADDDKPDNVGWLQRMCRAAARVLPASGVGVSLMSNQGDQMTVAASDAASARIEELQFTLGEGPCLDAYSLQRPVLTPDLAEQASSRWPTYAPAAHDHGVRAVFAFPLQIGAHRLGALDVYRDVAGALSPAALHQALNFAEVALHMLVRAEQSPSEIDMLLSDALETRLEVYQAQGMVMIQLGVDAAAALDCIRAYAYSHDRRIGDVSDDIVARRLSLEVDGRG